MAHAFWVPYGHLGAGGERCTACAAVCGLHRGSVRDMQGLSWRTATGCSASGTRISPARATARETPIQGHRWEVHHRAPRQAKASPY